VALLALPEIAEEVAQSRLELTRSAAQPTAARPFREVTAGIAEHEPRDIGDVASLQIESELGQRMQTIDTRETSFAEPPRRGMTASRAAGMMEHFHLGT
jgi:hypothetical protein